LYDLFINIINELNIAMSKRIFIGLTEAAGYCNNLMRGFKQLGLKCSFIDLSKNFYEFGNEDSINNRKFSIKLFFKPYLHRLINKKTSSSIIRISKILRSLLKFFLFLWVIFKFDIFIFSCNSTFLNFYDLPILSFFKKKIIYLSLGSDSRPQYLNGTALNELLVIKDYNSGDKKKYYKNLDKFIKSISIKKKTIKRIEKYADVLVNHPTSGYFHERPFVLVLALGLPFDVSVNSQNRKKRNYFKNGSNSDVKVRIVHAPSQPISKGTPQIREAIKNLKKKGYVIDFIEIIGKPHHFVLEMLKDCDFVIDALYSDSPLGMLGVEAAFFGKPTVASGYYSKFIKNDIPEEYIPYSFYCNPEDIEDLIEKLIVNKSLRLSVGRKAKEFIRHHSSPEEVAKRFLRLVEGEIPSKWVYDPMKISYIYGEGFPKNKLKDVLCDIINRGGIEALQLHDKRFLEKKFLQFTKS